MKIIEAIWEKRNLGVTCLELEIEKNDSVEEVVKVINDDDHEYVVAKVIVGRMDILSLLQEKGYIFLETLFETEIDLRKKPQMPEICRKIINDHVGYHIACLAEIDSVIKEIKKGEIFSTDRIALDSFFSKRLAGQRYANWTKDVMDSGKAKMIITEYDSKSIGFNVLIDKGNIIDGMLGGLFSDYLNSGLGFANAGVAVNSAYDLGAKKMISHVSSNNFQMFKLHMLFGLHVKRINYVLIMHKRKA